MPTTANVSIVIPTLHEEGTIRHLLTDLNNQTILPHEIIVVDGGSGDKTTDIVRQFNHVLLLHDKPSPSGQRNCGWRKTTQPIVIFLDADVKIHDNFISTVLSAFQKDHIDIGCPRYIPLTQDLMIKCIYNLFNQLFYMAQSSLPSGAGSCIIAKKTILEKTNGFNENIKYDDIYFLRQAAQYGKFKIIDTEVFVSVRRFERYGTWSTFLKYLILSILFTLGAYRLANIIHYPFANYAKKPQ